MTPRRWPLALALVLLALLGVVATLQYRWAGEVSNAERERLRSTLQARGSEFTAAIDRDITRTFALFQVDPAAFDRDPAGALADAAAAAASETASGASVKAIYVAEPGVDARVRQLDVRARTLSDASWPADLSTVRARVAALPPETAMPGLPLLPGFFNDPIDRQTPALIVPVNAAAPRLVPRPGHVVVTTVPGAKPWRAVVVWLDAAELASRLVAPAVQRQFGDPETSEFNVSVLNTATRQSIYDSGPTVDVAMADFASAVFGLRLNDLVWSRGATPAPPEDTHAGRKNSVAITIFRRGAAGDPGAPGAVQQGAAWTLAVQAKRGSLDAVVARSRTRNLAVGLGVLAVLGAGIGLILVTSAREQRLARQQLEFVASVSHELRTPLAVIRSAGENLADGVVGDARVREYGALIRTEGRRLSDMVERVMDFAGISAGTLIRTRRPIDVAAVLRTSVEAIRADAEARDIAIDVRAGTLPPVTGDSEALTSALQNAIGNAVKYSGQGGRVEVDAAAVDRTVRVTVADRGIGIDEADLPHVFKPFYRGRRAIDSQVRGSGVGLSVVQKIVEAHGGEARIARRDGGGTVLTITLPIAPATPAEQA